MTIRDLAQRFGKPLVIIIISIFALLTVRKSLPDVAKLHPQNNGLLAAGVALFIVSYLVGAFGWHLLLRALGQPIALRDSARMFFLSLIARWIPGRIWYSATRLYIGRQVGLSVTAVAFGIVLELIYTLLGGVIVTVAFAGALLKGVFSSPHGQLALWGLVALIVVAGTLAVRPSTLTSLSRLSFVRKIMKKIAGEELSDENRPEMSTASSLMLILYFGFYWIFAGVMFGVLTSAFIPMNTERWIACVPAFAGSWLIGFFSIVTPAGIGVREFAMTVMLQQSMGQAAALVMSVASRVAMMFTELLLAGIASLFLRGQMADMPFRTGKTILSNGPSPTPPGSGVRRPYPLDVTMRMTVNPGLQVQPQTTTATKTPLNGARTAEAAATARLTAFSSAPPEYAPPSHNGNGLHASRSISRTRMVSAQRWTLVKRRPCFCGREQRQNGRIPSTRYKPWKPLRVLTEDL